MHNTNRGDGGCSIIKSKFSFVRTVLSLSKPVVWPFCMEFYTNINDKYLPPRILQNVHGYFELNTRYPTRLDLSNSWDKYTVENSRFFDNPQNVDFVPVVYFYAIDTKTFCPIEISPKPCPITAEYDYQNSTSKIIKLKGQSWIGSMETIVRYVTSI